MRFLAYTPVAREELRRQLGEAEYSYVFVLEKFLPILRRLGEVIVIQDPWSEADALFLESLARGEDCRLICFAPPHRAPTALTCPTTMVVAWEFDTIPDEAWGGDPRNDWRTVFADHGQAIMLSRHSRDAVLRAMGADFPVTVMPAPVFDRVAGRDTREREKPDRRNAALQVSGLVIDTRELCVTTHHLVGEESVARDLACETWDGARRTLGFSHDAAWPDFLSIAGFYPRESWGCWSEASDPWIILPFMLTGVVELSLLAQGLGSNIGRTVSIAVGPERHSIILTGEPCVHAFTVTLDRPTNLIKFDGLDAQPIPGLVDGRTMALGVHSLTMERKRAADAQSEASGAHVPKPWAPARVVALDGVVYTSVLNPEDGRKNWGDILTAFCFALRDKADATLVLKMTHHSSHPFIESFMRYIRAIGPTDCRVVLVNAFLDDATYAALRDRSTFYVNASHGEGLCIPLMEFMSAGAPAIAPRHTAMVDYISDDSTFIVDSTIAPAVWPQDPAARLKAVWHSIDWGSLARRFRESYEVAVSDPDRYRGMSAAAIRSQASYSSDASVERLLRAHLGVEAV